MKQELWVTEDYCNVFLSEDEVQTFVAETYDYIGSDGLLMLFENGTYYQLETFEDILEHAKREGYTVLELCKEFDIDIKEFVRCSKEG